MLDDRDWVCRIAADAGLTLVGVVPPRVRNHQWVLMFAHSRPGVEPVGFPEDNAPIETVITPPMPAAAYRIGLTPTR